mgnify:CR=1 FL=1
MHAPKEKVHANRKANAHPADQKRRDGIKYLRPGGTEGEYDMVYPKNTIAADVPSNVAEAFTRMLRSISTCILIPQPMLRLWRAYQGLGQSS